jgi:hypothetical protein
MCADEDDRYDSFEDAVRSFAREIGDYAERMKQVDVDEIAESIGVDPERARQWVDLAGGWLRSRAENLGEEVTLRATGATRRPVQDPLASAAPHPLDVPTEEQGLALAALDSGRWTVEPGSHALAARGEGPAPSDALGLVRELHVRDWITNDGEVTLVGHHALSRWLVAATPS